MITSVGGAFTMPPLLQAIRVHVDIAVRPHGDNGTPDAERVAPQREDGPNRPDRLFSRLDKDGDGHLSPSEFRRLRGAPDSTPLQRHHNDNQRRDDEVDSIRRHDHGPRRRASSIGPTRTTIGG